MYNWSVDEKKFKNVKEIIDFLKKQPELIRVKVSKKKDKFGNIIIKTGVNPKIHPVRKFLIAKILEEKTDGMKISVIIDHKMEKFFR